MDLLFWLYTLLGSYIALGAMIWIVGFIPKAKTNDPVALREWFNFPYIYVSGTVISVVRLLGYLIYIVCATLTLVFGFSMNAFYLVGVAKNPMSRGHKLAHMAMAIRNISMKEDIEQAIEKERNKWSNQHENDKNTINQLTAARKHWEKQAKKIRQEYFAFNQKVQGAVANHETFKAMKGSLQGNVVPNVQGYSENQNTKPQQQYNNNQPRNNGNGGKK